MATPRTLSDWRNTYAQAGSVLSLVYLAPVACDDERAAVTVWAAPDVTDAGPFTATGIVPALRGWRRNGQILEVFAILTNGRKLGDILPARLQPCGTTSTLYSLQAVHLLRDGGNLLQISIARFNKILTTNPGTVLGEAGATVVGTATDVAVRAALPLVVPLAIAGIVYWQVTKRLRP